jgi:hypothetical protein
MPAPESLVETVPEEQFHAKIVSKSLGKVKRHT